MTNPGTDPHESGDTSLQQRAEAAEEQAARALARYREMVASGPGLIAEMVTGSSIEEIDASAEAARAAYVGIARRIASEHEQHIPAGNPARSTATPGTDALKPEAKIALGLRAR